MNEATPKPVIFLAFANNRENYLHNLQLEQRRIREALEIAQEKGLCLLVERANTTIRDIVSVFQKYPNRIAIFHYGGHADDNLLQLETETGSLSNASSKGLVPFLAEQKGLQLVFINGCSSKPQAEALIAAGNSAVVGTARPIDDTVATLLSEVFYQGLAAGQSIDNAWKEAVNAVKMKKGDENYRAVSWKGKEETLVNGFPWEIYYPKDNEFVKGWNLPDAAGDPLFGLPEIPLTNWPEKPLRHLDRYERPHARVFFGRSSYIRNLYTRIKDPKSDPIILLHGQSGVGKSSLLDAGLNPRLEEEHTVIYLRREQEKGLTGTLVFALEQKLAELRAASAALKSLPGTAATEQDPRWQAILQLQAAAQSLDEQSVRQEIEALITRLHSPSDIAPATAQTPAGNDANDARGRLLVRWRELERLTGKPLVATLDQVEELYTRPHLQGPKAELEEFLSALQSLFGTPASRPRGKLLLCCRTGYPRIEEALEKAGLPRATMMLGGFRKEDILDIFRGLTSPNLFRRYQLTVDDELPAMIADDLLEDKDSPGAPVLQILLNKMWDTVKRENSGMRSFTVEQYLKLKRDGTLISEFFAQQMAQLRAWQPEVVDSGLALDILHFPVTAKETIGTCSLDELRKTYEHRREIFGDLIAKLRELSLLTEAPNRTEHIGLIHDCLAPVVAKKYLNSTHPGQVARRILENKLTDSKRETLGETDLQLVLAGRAGTKQLAPEEEDLLKRSDRRIKFKWRAWRVGTATFVLFLFGVLIYVGQKREKAEKAIADASLAVGFMSRIHAKLDTVPGARDVQLELVDKTDDLKRRLGMSPAGGVSEPPAATFWKKLQDGDNEKRRANVDRARALYDEARLIACGEAISGNSVWWRRLLSSLSPGDTTARVSACSEGESGDSVWRRNLMVSYQSLGELEKDAGNLKIALDHFEKARQIAERTAREKTEDRQAQRDLAIAWSDLGGLQPDDDQRLESYDKARQIAEKLASVDPKNPERQRELFSYYKSLGDLEKKRARLEKAFDWYVKAFDIANGLALADQSDPKGKLDLATAYTCLGDLHKDSAQGDKNSGHFQSADSSYKKAIDIADGLADPGGHLTMSYIGLAELHDVDNNPKLAAGWYDKAVELDKRLAQVGTDRIKPKIHLAHTYIKLGKRDLNAGKLRSSRDWLKKALEVAEPLAGEAPGNLTVQNSLWISYTSLGDVATDERNIKAARQWYEKALPISVCLREPGDLWMSYRNLGDVSKEEGDPKAARVWYEKALAIARDRAEKQQNVPEALEDLSTSYGDIGNVEKAREWKTRAGDLRARAERKK